MVYSVVKDRPPLCRVKTLLKSPNQTEWKALKRQKPGTLEGHPAFKSLDSLMRNS